MREGLIARRLATLMSIFAARGLVQGRRSELALPWTAWNDGAIALARQLAQDALAAHRAPDEANHLLFLTSFVTGDYRAALGHYRAIGPSYRRLTDLIDTVLDAYVHLDGIAEALEFARGQKGVSPVTVQRLEAHVARPLRVHLTGVGIVPFADHPLARYLPGLSAEINGGAVTAHIDTGGTFLVMGPERATALGIETVRAGKTTAHLNSMRVDQAYGIADRLVLGGVVMHNVPVDILSTLTGDSDLVIVGTNVLEQFVSTLDYPGRRLVLSKRGDASARASHLAMLPAQSVAVPFYLWSDHFMFARGSFGERRDLNYFVDSGLVSVHPDGKGGTRQACFTTSKRKLKAWGIPAAEIKRGFFESSQPLGLGALQQDRPLLVVGAAGDTTFGGVRIDGLISHAFLERYTWTIDFDVREYRFAEQRDSC